MQIVHFPVTGRLPAAFAGTRLVLQLLRLPAHSRFCMHGRPPAYTNVCKAGYRLTTDVACEFAGYRLTTDFAGYSRLCMHGRPPAYTNVCEAGYRLTTDVACEFAGYRLQQIVYARPA